MTNNKTLPLYMVVYESLKSLILSGKYKPDEYLPSEKELQSQYDVSRITIRRSLQELEQDGFVQRVQGKGTRVLRRKKYSDLYKLTGFTEAALKSGDRPTSIVLKCDTINATVQIAEFLQIEPNEEIYYLKRLRLINGRVHAVHETFISKRFSFVLNQNDFDDQTSLYELYTNAGIELGDATETIGAILPNKNLRRELFIEHDTPVFVRDRITYTDEHKPIEYSKNFYIAEGYKYVVRLHKSD